MRRFGVGAGFSSAWVSITGTGELYSKFKEKTPYPYLCPICAVICAKVGIWKFNVAALSLKNRNRTNRIPTCEVMTGF